MSAREIKAIAWVAMWITIIVFAAVNAGIAGVIVVLFLGGITKPVFGRRTRRAR